jgi:hypothetical protein
MERNAICMTMMMISQGWLELGSTDSFGLSQLDEALNRCPKLRRDCQLVKSPGQFQN